MTTTPTTPTTPTATTKTFYNFMEMIDHVNEVLGYDQRHAGNPKGIKIDNFNDWRISKGYGEKDSVGKHFRSSQIWYAEYVKEIASGEWEEAEKFPNRDFWIWQLDNCVTENFANDSYSSVCIDVDGTYIDMDKLEPWQQEIQQVWHDEFKHLAHDGYWIDIWVCW